MNTAELHRAVARAIGEPLSEIRRRGFGLADPAELDCDRDAYDRPPTIVDWDQLYRERLRLFP